MRCVSVKDFLGERNQRFPGKRAYVYESGEDRCYSNRHSERGNEVPDPDAKVYD